jgi:hypothetical protein
MKHQRHLAALGLLFSCVLVTNLPFVRQAFHMDDGIFLLMARNVARAPFFPQDIATYFEGLFVPDLASTEHPLPLTSYWMWLSAWLGHGFTEVNLHLGFLIFPLILAGSMYALSRRMTAHPLLASMTLLVLPVVSVVSHTLMTDIAQLALAMTAIALVVTGIETNRRLYVWSGAFAAALACFVSYASLCLIPLLAFFAFRRGDTGALKAVLIVPAIMLGMWLALSFSHYQRLPPGQVLTFYLLVKKVLAPSAILRKFIYIVLVIGGVTIFPLARFVSARRKLIAISAVLALPALWISDATSYSLSEKTLFFMFFCAGLVAIVESIEMIVSKNETDRFLARWFAGMLVFCATAYMTGAARYILLTTPALVLLFYRRLEQIWDSRKLQLFGAANLILCSVLGLILSRADFQFAGMYREFASTLQRSNPGGTRLWFDGEWEFRAYLESFGGEPLGRRDARPHPGDLLAVATLATPYSTLFDNRINLDSIVLVAPSKVEFPLSELRMPANGVFELTLGMPLADQSDGIDFVIGLEQSGTFRRLFTKHMTPAEGGHWSTLRIPLSEANGRETALVLISQIAGTPNADWMSVARARIWDRDGANESAPYDLSQHLKDARIESSPGLNYGTPNNIPVFPMTILLPQEAKTTLRGVYDYQPESSVRLLDAGAHAGFWSMNWGMLPFSFRHDSAPLESIRLYEVTQSADGYGESTPAWYSGH